MRRCRTRQGLAVRFWRGWVVLFARPLPIESPAVCMAFSATFLLTALFLLPGLETWARVAPLVSDALGGSDGGWRWLRYTEWGMLGGAYACAWMFQARCLQICFPEFYDAHADL